MSAAHFLATGECGNRSKIIMVNRNDVNHFQFLFRMKWDNGVNSYNRIPRSDAEIAFSFESKRHRISAGFWPSDSPDSAHNCIPSKADESADVGDRPSPEVIYLFRFISWYELRPMIKRHDVKLYPHRIAQLLFLRSLFACDAWGCDENYFVCNVIHCNGAAHGLGFGRRLYDDLIIGRNMNAALDAKTIGRQSARDDNVAAPLSHGSHRIRNGRFAWNGKAHHLMLLFHAQIIDQFLSSLTFCIFNSWPHASRFHRKNSNESVERYHELE